MFEGRAGAECGAESGLELIATAGGGRFHRYRLGMLAALVVALAALAVSTDRAGAMIYWAEAGEDRIGRANLDGSGVDPSFIEAVGAGDVVTTDTHVYWTSSVGGGRVGRANLDGSDVDVNFISGIAVDDPWSIAASDQRLYWSADDISTIASAKLDGTDVVADFLTVIEPRGVAVNDTHIYWTRAGGLIGDVWVARASLSGANASHQYIAAENAATRVAVNNSFVFWLGLPGAGTIGRSTVGNTGVDPDFITGQAGGQDIALHGNRIYWSKNSGEIGRASLDGSGLNGAFMSGLTFPVGLWVDEIRNAGRNFTFGKVKVRPRNGTATLRVQLPGPGRLALAGKGLKRSLKKHAETGSIALEVRPKGALAGKLRKTGKATARAKVTFSPKLGNGSRTKTKKIKLKRNR